MTSPALVEVSGVTRLFGAFAAVRDVSFAARGGEILALLGPNGAGKTTLFRMILGLLRPTAGRILVGGREAGTLRRGDRPRVGYLSQRFGLWPLLTGYENIDFCGGAAGLHRSAVRARTAGLERRLPPGILRRRVGEVPSGYRQEIALFCCLLGDPDIVVMDEPTSGAGPALRLEFWRDLRDRRAAGTAVLVTTHDVAETEFSDRLLIMDRGRVAWMGAPAEAAAGGRTVESIYAEALGRDARV